MKIYTKTGDDGTTSLFDGSRTFKNDPRVDLYGEIDELNGTLGLAISFLTDSQLKVPLIQVQKDLFSLGAKLANPKNKTQKDKADFNDDKVLWLETTIDSMDKTLPAMTNFILPGGSPQASALHISRSVCRRVERKMVGLQESHNIDDLYIKYINRLSDYLFVCARFSNQEANVNDIDW